MLPQEKVADAIFKWEKYAKTTRSQKELRLTFKVGHSDTFHVQCLCVRGVRFLPHKKIKSFSLFCQFTFCHFSHFDPLTDSTRRHNVALIVSG